MNAISSILLLGTGTLLVLVAANSKPRRRKRLRNVAANSVAHSAGLRIQKGKLKVVDWNEWMRQGPALIKVAMLEGTDTAEQVTANVLKRLFPQHPWPPEKSDPFYSTWKEMNVMVARALGSPTQPHFEVVS